MGLANNLLEFLQVHKMDTDSALIGLSPSNFTYDTCIEQERHLPHQLIAWKTMDGSGLKQEVRKTAEKVKEWTSIEKGSYLFALLSRFHRSLQHRYFKTLYLKHKFSFNTHVHLHFATFIYLFKHFKSTPFNKSHTKHNFVSLSSILIPL